MKQEKKRKNHPVSSAAGNIGIYIVHFIKKGSYVSDLSVFSLIE
jgi:hypothetical protein